MAATTNNKKKKMRINQRSEEEDRISKLSDDLLHRILSFVTSKQAVQTCILSKRWQHLWRYMPVLNFNYTTFTFPTPPDVDVESDDFDEDYYDPDKLDAFLSFTFQFLLSRHQQSGVSTFQFSCSHDIFSSEVWWLKDYALRHDVRKLKIHASCSAGDDNDYDEDDDQVPLPDSKSLTVLKLKGLDNSIDLPQSIGLQHLTVVHLEEFKLSDHNFDGRIFSSPNLKKLRLKHVIMNDLQVCSILAPRLTHLEISQHFDTTPDRCECKLVVCAPKLMSFKFEGLFPLVCFMGDLPSLDEVLIAFNYLILSREFRGAIFLRNVAAPRLIKMLQQLRNVKSLTLSLGTLKLISKAPLALLEGQPSPMYNLKDINLKVYARRFRGVKIPEGPLMYFLNSSPDARPTLFLNWFTP